MNFRRYVTEGDAVLAAGMLILAAVLFFTAGRDYGARRHVVVEVSGARVLELPLDSDVTRTVRGPRGETVVCVEGSRVCIIESACPNHYCIRMGSISHTGEIIVCVPNQVLVTIRGGREQSFDGVTQ
jgi:hypothetical protein